jgi:predicted dinucleotide-utilizing enzyme
VRIDGVALSANPKTSLLTPCSVVRTLTNLCRPIALA